MNRGSREGRNPPFMEQTGFNEAPIHESGKSVDGRIGGRLRGASMRPRFMNRGSLPPYKDRRRLPRASMRPRFMNRGSASQVQPKAAKALGFNEAPIHESGKLRTSSDIQRRGYRFNEAPIHESGKSSERVHRITLAARLQ